MDEFLPWIVEAVGWLSALPEAGLARFLSPSPPAERASRADVGVSPEERAAFRMQAREDIDNFYLAGVAELRPGSKLLVQVFGRNDHYDTANGSVNGTSDVMLDMVDDKLIPAGVYGRCILPVFYRSLEELLPQPGENNLNPAFRIDKAQARECHVSFNDQFFRTGDRRAWAESFAGFIRPLSEPGLAAGFPDLPDRPKLVQELYQRMVSRFASEPERYAFH